MTGLEVGWVFEEIADLLELKGENQFKVRAYRQASKTMRSLSRLAIGLDWKEVQKLPGIGSNLQAKIEELCRTGRCSYLEDLRREVPVEIREMLAIPGLGVKSVRLIYERLGVTTIEELLLAAKERRVRQLPGLGNKTELNIIRGVELLQGVRGMVPLGVAEGLGCVFLEDLSALKTVSRLSLVGEVRRGKEMVSGVEIIVETGVNEREAVLELVSRHPEVRSVEDSGDSWLRVVNRLGIKVTVHTAPAAEYASAMVWLTGSEKHVSKLQERALRRNLLLTQEGLFRKEGPVLAREENDLFDLLGMQWIPPELRENLGEIEAAEERRLPELISQGDIRGDLHVHSNWSDGVNSLQELAQEALARGYSYLAITDHSQSLPIARGLKVEKLRKQREELRMVNEEIGSPVLLAGVEVDILPDGRLDYPEEILEESELVIASIHSGFQQSRDEITARFESAMKNPHVDIIGHLTGRILGRRFGYAVDLRRVLELAVETGTALEINASLDRLDMGAELARQAGELGVMVSIGTDAHDLRRFGEMAYGVTTARRGWLGKSGVLNSMNRKELLDWLASKKP